MSYDALFMYAEPAAMAILMALLIVPVLIHLFTGWSARRSEIVGAMSEEAASLYFRQFYPALTSHGGVLRALDQHYLRRYGRRHYVLPLLLLAIIAFFLLALTTHTLLHWLLGTTGSYDLPSLAVGAIAGAYMWVVADILLRCRQRQLAPIDLYWAGLRFVVSVPLGFAFAGVLKDQAAVGIAFLLGAFPTNTLLTIARRIGTRKLGLAEGGEEAQAELEQIEGISQGLAERFRDEGISTILQLAYADPVDLAIRTSFAFNYVIDCVSQALAWIYLEKDLATMRRLSLRGAQEINTLLVELDDGEDRDKETARTTIERVAALLKIDEVVFERLLREIAFDPYTEFIVNVWNAVDDGAEPDGTEHDVEKQEASGRRHDVRRKRDRNSGHRAAPHADQERLRQHR